MKQSQSESVTRQIPVSCPRGEEEAGALVR